VSERQRADERRFNASAKIRRAAHGPSKALAAVAAYGEVVWSWHPLLMLSLAEIKSAQSGLDWSVIREATVTNRNSSPARARRTPLKPLRGESRVISAYSW
jgi:hypothetical protein